MQVCQPQRKQRRIFVMSDIKSLAHSKWNCKYHIVFAPKYRRQIIYGKLKGEIGKILGSCVSKKK